MAFSLACDDGTTPTVLRIEGADTAVTWNDIWEYGAGGGTGTVTGDANGDATVSDFMTEHLANAMYQIHKNIEFGDGTNSLEFLSRNESVYFDDEQVWRVMDNTTLELGQKSTSGDGPVSGAHWRIYTSTGNPEMIAITDSNAVFNIYGSTIVNDGVDELSFSAGTVDVVSSIFFGGGYNPEFKSAVSASLVDVICSDGLGPKLKIVFDKMSDIKTVDCNYLFLTQASIPTIKEIENIGSGNPYLTYMDATDVVTIINPESPLSGVDGTSTNDAGASLKEQWTINALVRYNGTAIENATVKLYDKDSTEIFSVSTDVNGQISEQEVTAREWEWDGSTMDLTSYNDFTLEISHADYPTYTQSGITLDEPIDWEIEMPISNTDLRSQVAQAVLKNDSNPIHTNAYGSVDVATVNEGDLLSDYLRKVKVLETVLNSPATEADEFIDVGDVTGVQAGDIIYITDGGSPANCDLNVVKDVEGGATIHLMHPVSTVINVASDVIVYSGKAAPVSAYAILDALTSDNTRIGGDNVDRAAKVLINKAVQDIASGAVTYYDDDGTTELLTHTPSDDGSDVTRTPS